MLTIQEMGVGLIAWLPASMASFTMIQTAVGVLLVYGLYRLLSIGSRDKRMPPGPPTLPILGNLHQIPLTGVYRKYVILRLFCETN